MARGTEYERYMKETGRVGGAEGGARGAAKGAQTGQTIGSIVGGVIGGAGGFLVGGPMGAVAGASVGMGVGGAAGGAIGAGPGKKKGAKEGRSAALARGRKEYQRQWKKKKTQMAAAEAKQRLQTETGVMAAEEQMRATDDQALAQAMSPPVTNVGSSSIDQWKKSRGFA